MKTESALRGILAVLLAAPFAGFAAAQGSPAGETPRHAAALIAAPNRKDARELYEIWQRHARANGDIPGAFLGELAAAVRQFIKYNPTWETVPKLNALLPRLDATRDWKSADAIALLDEVAAVKDSPLSMAMRRGTRHTIRNGEALPEKFTGAAWGQAQPNGLRAAWALEPGAAEHRIGAALKARLLVWNPGAVPVMLQVPTWYQGGVKATDAKGAEVEISGVEWTTIAQLVPVRLGPGEYIEIYTPGIGFGPRAGMGPWAGPRVGSNVLAKPGDGLTLTHGPVPLDGSEVGMSEDDPHVIGPGWWQAHIKTRLARELPLPADAAERTRLLDRAVRELFAAAPTAPAKFRVLAADPAADKTPRVVLGPGEYPLPSATTTRGGATLKIVGRSVGDRRTNDAQLLFAATEFTGLRPPDPHQLEVPDGWGTWAIVCRPRDGFFYLLHKGGVRKIDYSAPRNVTDTPANDQPAEFREEVKRQLEIAGVSAGQQAEVFEKPAPPATTPAPKTGANVPASDEPPLKPKHESAQSLFRKWQESARTDGKIPGALIRHVAREMDNFFKRYPADEKAPKLAALRPRCDASHDWPQAEVVALLDDITAISTAPISWATTPMESSEMWKVRTGEPLPIEMKNAAWGSPAKNGLRAAWLLEPRAEEYALGTVLKARVLFHNSGTKPVMFKTETWHQDDPHTARDARGGVINVENTFYTGETPLATYRLEPGEYVTFHGHGIGIGAGEYREERSTGSVGAWIEAKEGDEVSFSSLVDASREGWTGLDDPKDPVELWKLVVLKRVEREAPLPSNSADREQLIHHVVRDLFGESPTAEEIATFTADNAPDALANLTARLQAKPRVEPFNGKLPTGETKFRVLAADPNAAKAPRTANAPGRCVLSDGVHLQITQTNVKPYRVGSVPFLQNKATIIFPAPEPEATRGPKPHEIALPNGIGTYRIAWERGAGVLWVMQKDLVRNYDFTNPWKVQETRFAEGGIINIPEHLRETMTKAFDVPGAPVQKQTPVKPDGATEKSAGASAPKLPKLPEEAYAKPGVHCQSFREEDAKRPGGELMGAVLEPSKPEDRDKEPLVLGVRTGSDAEWRIGGTAKVGLVVRNRGDHDVKFSYSDLLASGITIIATDERGHEHKASVPRTPHGFVKRQQMLLPPGHMATVREFTMHFDTAMRDIPEGPPALLLPPGKYKLRCRWHDASPTDAHEGEWTGELVSGEHPFSSLPPATEQKLKWGEPVNGLRAALVMHPVPDEPDAEDKNDIFLVVQNVSEAKIRLHSSDAAPNPRQLICREKRVLETITESARPIPADFQLQPREVAFFRMLLPPATRKPGGRNEGSVIEASFRHDPHFDLTGKMEIATAPAGAWTGKLLSGKIKGGTAIPVDSPKENQRPASTVDGVPTKEAYSTPAAEKPKGAAVKLTPDALLGAWRGTVNGEKLMLSFHRSPVEKDLQLDIYFGEATIGALAKFTIAEDGGSAAVVQHNAGGGMKFGTLTPAGAGKLKLELFGRQTGQMEMLLTRDADAPATEPQQAEARELFEMWKTTANEDGTIPGTFIRALATEVRAYVTANPNLDSGMKLPKLLPRFVTSRDWTQAEAIKLLDDVAHYSTAPITARVAKAKLPSGPVWRTMVEFQDIPVQIAKWSEAKDGLRVGMRVVEADWHLGGKVRVELWLHNAGGNDVTFLTSSPDRQGAGVSVAAIGADGRENRAEFISVLITELLQRCTLPAGHVAMAKSLEVKFAEPDKGGNARFVPGFRELLPGKYQLRCKWGAAQGSAKPGDWTGTLTAPELDFTLAEKTAAASETPKAEKPKTETPKRADAAAPFREKLAELDARIAALKMQRERLSGRFATKHPNIRTLDGEVKALEEARASFVTTNPQALSPKPPAASQPLLPPAAANPASVAQPLPEFVFARRDWSRSAKVAVGGGVTVAIHEEVINRADIVARALIRYTTADGAVTGHDLLIASDVSGSRAKWAYGWVRGTKTFWYCSVSPDNSYSLHRVSFADPQRITDDFQQYHPGEEPQRTLGVPEAFHAQLVDVLGFQKWTVVDKSNGLLEISGQNVVSAQPVAPAGVPVKAVASLPLSKDKRWNVQFVDATTGQPVPRLRATVTSRTADGSRTTHVKKVVSDGVFERNLNADEYAWVSVVDEAWTNADAAMRLFGNVPVDAHAAEKHTDPDSPFIVKVRPRTKQANAAAAAERELPPADGPPVRPKLPDDVYAKVGVPIREFDAGAVTWSGEQNGLCLGMSVEENAEWRIGGGVKVELWVCNPGEKDVKFQHSGRRDIGLRVLMKGADGKEHAADIMQFLGRASARPVLLPAGHVFKAQEFSVVFLPQDGKAAGAEPHFTLAAGAYKFRCELKLPGLTMAGADGKLRTPAEGEWTGTLKSGEVDVKLVAADAPKTAGTKAEAPKPDTTPAFLAPGVMPKRTHLFNDRHSAIAVQSEKDVNFVLIYAGALSSGMTESSSEASGKWGFEGNVHLVDREKTKAAGKKVDKRVVAVKYTSDAPATLFLDGKAYDLAAQPRMTPMGALEATPGHVFLLRDEGEPFQTHRTHTLRNEQDLATIGVFAVGDCFSAGVYADSRRVQQMEGWVLALDVQVPLRHSGGERSARLRIFPDCRVLSLPDGRKLSELKISAAELAELLRWLAEDQKVPAVKLQAAQPGDPKPGIAQEFDTWAGGVSYFQFKYNGELHDMTVGSHLRNPGTGKELANPGAAAFKTIYERLAELERKAVPAPVKAGADAAKPDAKPPGANIVKVSDDQYVKSGFPADELAGEDVMWNDVQNGLSLGYRIMGDEWRILGKQLKVELWVRNPGDKDVKFQLNTQRSNMAISPAWTSAHTSRARLSSASRAVSMMAKRGRKLSWSRRRWHLAAAFRRRCFAQ